MSIDYILNPSGVILIGKCKVYSSVGLGVLLFMINVIVLLRTLCLIKLYMNILMNVYWSFSWNCILFCSSSLIIQCNYLVEHMIIKFSFGSIYSKTLIHLNYSSECSNFSILQLYDLQIILAADNYSYIIFQTHSRSI